MSCKESRQASLAQTLFSGDVFKISLIRHATNLKMLFFYAHYDIKYVEEFINKNTPLPKEPHYYRVI